MSQAWLFTSLDGDLGVLYYFKNPQHFISGTHNSIVRWV